MRPRPIDLSAKQVILLVLTCIRDRSPISVVRFGEGEGRLLVADPDDAPSVRVARRKLRRQTGQMLSPSEMFKVQSLVSRAFDRADVVCIRGDASFDEEHLHWVDRIETAFDDRVALGRKPGYVTHCLVNNDLREALPELLADQARVSVISSRDLQETITRAYGLEEVRMFQLPSQHIMRGVDGDYEAAMHGVPMWPEFYEELFARLTVREPGEVFLVGAGVFGKDLCVRVRELGGVALDMGSSLDTMAGKITRGHGRPEPHRDLPAREAERGPTLPVRKAWLGTKRLLRRGD